MIEKDLIEYVNSIEYIDEKARDKAALRQTQLAKPPGALGKLEDISIKFAGITGKVKNYIKKKAVVIFSSDNGVVEEGVTPTPQSVTAAQTINFTLRSTGVGALAKTFGVDLCVVDIGVKSKFPEAMISSEMCDFIDDKIIDLSLIHISEPTRPY